MHIGVSVGRAVCGDQQIRVLKIRRVCWYQLYLAGPLGQLRAMRIQSFLLAPLLFQLLISQHSFLVISSRLTFYEADGSHRTFRQTVSQPVAVIVSEKLSLSIHHSNGALMARRRAGSAAIALFR